MKALTIWQPWATLIIAGAKPYEFRGWWPPPSIQTTRIAIHAGARAVKRGEVQDLLLRLRSTEAWSTGLHAERAIPILERALVQPGSLPLASVLGSAVLGVPRLSHQIIHEFGGKLNDSDRDEHANWAWPMLDVRPLEPFAPARGAQGFWNWDASGELGL